MSLLELDHVSKRLPRGTREQVALREVSLAMDVCELVAVWGRRRSGRSTLMRVAAALERPDAGVVRLEGHDLNARGAAPLGLRVGYCRRTFRPTEGRFVVDQLMRAPLTRGVSPADARAAAQASLERVGAERLGSLEPDELEGAESARVAIARALAASPKLLVIDEPTIGVELLSRDEILLLIRSLADEGMAVLMSTGEGPDLAYADRALALTNGELRGTLAPQLADVVALRPSAARSESA